MHWPSQKPISRKRWVTLGESGNCLIRTDDPPRTRLSGMADESGCSGWSDELEVVADCMLGIDPSQKAMPDYTGFVFHRPFFDKNSLGNASKPKNANHLAIYAKPRGRGAVKLTGSLIS